MTDFLDTCVDDERIHPCDDCGVMRTKAEGGAVFTVCDECWDRKYAPTPTTGSGGVDWRRLAIDEDAAHKRTEEWLSRSLHSLRLLVRQLTRNQGYSTADEQADLRVARMLLAEIDK